MAVIKNKPEDAPVYELREVFKNPRLLQAFEDLFAAVPGDYNLLVAEINDLDARVTALEPQYVTITSADSPYQANDMDYILCDMDGDIDVLVPISGRFWVSRDGASNTLTIVGTINDCVDPEILFDGTSRTFAKIVDDWRVIR
jgi:hypothetical protein